MVATARRAEALEALAARAPGISPAPGDITDAEGIAALVGRIVAEHGRIDIALLNAGTYTPVLPEDFTPDVFRPQVEVNIMGTVNCIAAVLPDMRRRHAGRIAVVASVTGFASLPMASAYGATKAFLISMCDSLRADLAGERSGVAVTVVAPGFVTTDLTEQNDFEMPFVIEAPEAATIIADGLEAGRRRDRVPPPDDPRDEDDRALAPRPPATPLCRGHRPAPPHGPRQALSARGRARR